MKKVLSFILVIAVAFTSLGLEGGKAYAQEKVVVGEQPYYEITMFVTEDDLKDEHHIDLTEYLDKQITAFVDTNFKVFYIKEVHDETASIPATTGSAITGSAITSSAITSSAITGSAITGSAITNSAITGSAITGSAIVYGKVKEIQKSQDVSILTLTSNNKDFYLWTTSDSPVLKSVSANDNNNYEFKIDPDGKIDEFRIAETETVYDPDLDYRVINRTINDKDIYDDRFITLNDDGKETSYAVSSAGLIVFKEVSKEVFTTGSKSDLTTGKRIEIHLKNNTVLFIKIRL